MISSVRSLSNFLKIKTVTNGMSLNNQNCHQLIECGLNEIEISLDGSSSSESEEVRIKSNTEKIVQNILQLIEVKNSKQSNLDIYVSSTQFLRSKSDVTDPKKLIAQTPQWLINLFGNNVKYKSHLAQKWPHMNIGDQFELATAKGDDKNYCDHPINTITIRANGDIVPCCYDLTSQMVMGNIMNDTIFDIFNGPKYSDLRKSVLRKEYIKACNVVRPHIYLIKSALPINKKTMY